MMRGESIREYIERNLDQSLVGQLYDVLVIFLSLFQVLVFVSFNRHGPGKSEDGQDFIEPLWSEYIEIIFGVIFTFDYVLRFYVARSRLGYVFSYFPIVDLLTVLPVWITVGLNIVLTGSIFTQHGVMPSNLAAQESLDQTSILRPIRVLRALRILRAYRLLAFSSSRVQRQIMKLGILVVCVVICAAGVMQELEACTTTLDPFEVPCQDLPYIDAMYFIVVTVTTLGYGDISPVTFGGKIVVMFSIVISAVAVPVLVSGLLSELGKRSEYEGKLKEIQQHEHVVVCGEITSAMIWNFVKEVCGMLFCRLSVNSLLTLHASSFTKIMLTGMSFW